MDRALGVIGLLILPQAMDAPTLAITEDLTALTNV